MRTTAKGVSVQGLTLEEAAQQLANSECPTCRQTSIHLLSTGNSPLAHWLTDTACGHSKLCLIRAWCPKCGNELLVCAHCGLTPYEHMCMPPGRDDSAALPPLPGAAAL